jgi:hypothetical protein
VFLRLLHHSHRQVYFDLLNTAQNWFLSNQTSCAHEISAVLSHCRHPISPLLCNPRNRDISAKPWVQLALHHLPGMFATYNFARIRTFSTGFSSEYWPSRILIVGTYCSVPCLYPSLNCKKPYSSSFLCTAVAIPVGFLFLSVVSV